MIPSALTNLLFLITTFAVSIATKTCSTQRIRTEDFEIACSDWEKIELTCRSDQVWPSFFAYGTLMLNATVESLVFRNCSFPDDVNLLNVTLALISNETENIQLQFDESRSWLSKESFKGFKKLKKLVINRSSVGLGDVELLYDVRVEEMKIQNMELGSIPDEFFKKLFKVSGLTYLYILHNKLQKIKRNDFAGLNELEELYLVNNTIQEIEPSALDPLVNLKILDISRNDLRTLPANTFKKHVKLEKLRISYNPLDVLPNELLRVEDSHLQRFTLRFNRGGLNTLPNGFFKDLKRLSTVIITNTNLTTLPSDLFDGAFSLTVLDLSHNNLVNLPPEIFQTTSNLKELHLRENGLASLPGKVFEEVNLEELYLDHNQLQNLSSDVFNGLSDLKILDISHNNLTHLGALKCPERVRNLQKIDLSYNKLTLENFGRPLSILSGCNSITDMNLAYNNISRIFPDWGFNTALKYLNLNGNQLKRITGLDLLSVLRTNAIMHLEYNPITVIDLKNFEEQVVRAKKDNQHAPNLNASVQLGNNSLNCDCKLLQLVRYYERNMDDEVYKAVNIIDNDARCMFPSQFSNVKIVDLNSTDLKCMTKTDDTSDVCNGTCTCWDYPGKEVLSVDCSYKNLTNIPTSIGNPHNWSIELNLAGNKLQETPSLNRSDLVNVTILDLSQNNISSVSIAVFSQSLRSLELHNNSISRLNDQVLVYLQEQNQLQHLTLHDNKWICDCEARQFLGIYQKKIGKLGYREVLCYGTNQKLSNVTANELCENLVTIIIVGCIMLATIAIAIGFLVGMYYKYQQEIKIWLYSKQWCLWFVTEDELDKDKQYDAFVSFSHKDEDFVIKEIVTKLEDGPRPYKLCLHYRDWIAGEWIQDQIARSIEESRRTIVVLSPSFLESIWGQMEFRTAHNRALSEGRARVIVILYGEIGNIEDLDPELKAYLSMNTYVKWGDPWFWDKLRYALPHKFEPSRRRTRNTHIIENHLNQLPMNNRNGNVVSEVVSMPNVTTSSTDSDRLLEKENEILATC